MLFEYLNERLFDGKLKLKKVPKWVSFFIPNTSFSFFNTIYVSNINEITNSTILHELQHTSERCYYSKYKFKVSFWLTMKFYFNYFLPQSISLLALLSVFNLMFLMFLMFILPIPFLSTMRRNIEQRGYFWNWYFGDEINYSKLFHGLMYYYMDYKHDNDYYNKLFQNHYDKLYFTTNDMRFKTFILLKEYKSFLFKVSKV